MGLDKETINRCAQTIHEAILETNDYSLFGPRGSKYYNEWFKIQSELYVPYFINPKKAAAVEEFIDDVIFKCLRNYDISLGNFENYFHRAMNLKEKDVKRKNEKYWGEHSSFEDPVGNDSENNQTYEDIIGDKKSLDYQERYENTEILRQCYLLAADNIIKGNLKERKKSYSYPKMVFSDMLAGYYVLKPDDCREFFESYHTKFDNAADIDFAASFFQDDCTSVTDFPQNSFRSLYEFTGDENDRGESCGNVLDNAKQKKREIVVLYNAVYIAYIAKKKGEAINAASISEQKNKILEKIFVEYKSPSDK